MQWVQEGDCEISCIVLMFREGEVFYRRITSCLPIVVKSASRCGVGCLRIALVARDNRQPWNISANWRTMNHSHWPSDWIVQL